MALYRSTTIVVIATAIFGNTATAVNWDFQPVVTLKESWTDNVRQSPADDQQSDFISEITPGISVHSQGARSSFDMDYHYQALFYRENSQDNTKYHQLNLMYGSEVWKEHLDLAVNVNYQQSIIDNRDSVPVNNSVISANRTDVANYQISPNFKWEMDSRTIFMVRPSYGQVKYRDLADSDSDIVQASVVLESKPGPHQPGWWFNWQQRDVRYENTNKIHLQGISFGIKLPVLQRFQWDVSGGREDNRINDQDLIPEEDRNYWETGFRWTPSSRTSISLTTGQRYYGDSHAFSFRHRTKYSNWDFEYTEQIETSALALQSLQPGQQDQPYVAPETIDGVEDELFVSKRFQGSWHWGKGKSAVDVDLVNETRELQITETTEKTRSGTLSYSWQYSARTRSRVSYTIRRLLQEDPGSLSSDIDDRLGTAELNLYYLLSKRITAELGYLFNKRDSDQIDTGHNTNVYSLSINGTF